MVTQKSKAIGIFATILFFFIASNNAFSVDKNSSFNVNVGEVLSVSISTPTSWASGDINTFLRNKININVVSTNTNGFTASMTTKTDDTSLVNDANSTYTLPTLSASTTRANFPANSWGYSIDDIDSGSDTSHYNALVGPTGTPITILATTSGASGNKDFYFGAKANITQAAGTYTGTVVISVVSGVIDPGTNPITPVNPAPPAPTPNTPTYNTSSGTTSYTYNPSVPNTNTSTTIVTEGDTRGSYEGYTPPQGVTRNFVTGQAKNNTALATGLALVATVAATSGLTLLFAARREEDDDEDSENMV